jgi:hypothetical protein
MVQAFKESVKCRSCPRRSKFKKMRRYCHQNLTLGSHLYQLSRTLLERILLPIFCIKYFGHDYFRFALAWVSEAIQHPSLSAEHPFRRLPPPSYDLAYIRASTHLPLARSQWSGSSPSCKDDSLGLLPSTLSMGRRAPTCKNSLGLAAKAGHMQPPLHGKLGSMHH